MCSTKPTSGHSQDAEAVGQVLWSEGEGPPWAIACDACFSVSENVLGGLSLVVV